MELDERIKEIFGQDTGQDKIQKIVALFNVNKEAEDKKQKEISEKLEGFEQKVSALEKEKGELLKETMSRKDKIKELESAKEKELSGKEKEQAELNKLVEANKSLQRRIVNQAASDLAVQQAEKLKAKLEADGKVLDMEKVKRFLSKHGPKVDGALDANGQAAFDQETVGVIVEAVNEATELFSSDKAAPAPAPNTGGETPDFFKVGEEEYPPIWDQSRKPSGKRLDAGVKGAQEQGLLDAAATGGGI